MRLSSVVDCALEGFRLTREQYRSVFAWAALRFFASMITLLSLGLFISPQVASQFVLGVVNTNISQFEKILVVLSASLPAEIFLQSIFSCAVFRSMLAHEEPKWAFLRLGLQECLLTAVGFIYFFALIICLFFSALGFTFLLRITDTLPEASGQIVTAIYFAGLTCILIYLAARLSLVMPLTFLKKRISLSLSWKITKNRYWFLIQCYGLAFIMGTIVLCLGLVIVSYLSSFLPHHITSWNNILSFPFLGTLALLTFIAVLVNIIILAPTLVLARSLINHGVSSDEALP